MVEPLIGIIELTPSGDDWFETEDFTITQCDGRRYNVYISDDGNSVPFEYIKL